MDNKILIHSCCAPCAAPAVERVQLDGYDIALYFSNSNIFPEAEYQQRLEYIRKLSQIYEVVLEEDLYDHDAWLEHISGFEDEPEKGLRCQKCFEFNLARTAELAERRGYAHFTTTLTLSPHKISKIIFALGAKFPNYIAYDFKKKNGFLRSIALSKEWELYRQSYCGCEFSMRTHS
jgi:predicted adenine nucleotide alpha hydrolase (AANH) superfamily ATPase